MKRISYFLSMILMMMFTTNVFAKDYSNYPQKFWDLNKNHWAYTYISELTDKNVINGYEDGSFRPENTVLRSEWAKMMCTASGKEPMSLENSNSYAVDYTSGDWYYGYINSIAQYMNFYQDDNRDIYFKPNQAVSREDVTVSLVKLKGYNVDNVDYSYITHFEDSNSISNNIKKYIAIAIEKGLISGYEDNTFRGQDTLTRAEAATLLCRAFQIGDDNKNTMTSIEVVVEKTPEPIETFCPTIPPINTPKPTKTSEPVIIPTKTPEVNNNVPSVENNILIESEKTPEPTKKPFIMDTIIKADVTPFSGSYNYKAFYTQDKNDNLYYYDNSNSDIVKINMLTKEKEILGNTKTLKIEYDGNEYSNMTLNGIFYDNYDNTLAIYGNFDSGAAIFENKPEPFSCIVELNTMKAITFKDNVLGINYGAGPEAYITHSISDYTFYGTLDSGEYLVNKTDSHNSMDYIINRDDFSRKELGGHRSDFYPPYEQHGDKVYFISMRGYLETLNINNNDEDIIISEMPFRGVINNNAYLLVSNAFGVFTLDGESILNIPFEDIEIADKKRFDVEDINMMLMATKNNDIVFYDMWNKCFRIVSANK